jgi:hypothetical protein
MDSEKTARRVPRQLLSLPICVERHEKDQKTWREIVPLKTISPIGASFYLKREFFPGQLLFLTMPLPEEFRCYDYSEENYATWSIVRHCNPLSKKEHSTFLVGVAFIGKYLPESYKQNPTKIYEIVGIAENGLWKVSEVIVDPTIRRQPRYSIPINIYLAIIDDTENILGYEKTVTENISLNGLAVFSTLDVQVGDKIKIIKEQGVFSATAIVRNRRVGADNLPRLHLEIIDANFPIEGIE